MLGDQAGEDVNPGALLCSRPTTSNKAPEKLVTKS